jgi:hypothetical protein
MPRSNTSSRASSSRRSVVGNARAQSPRATSSFQSTRSPSPGLELLVHRSPGEDGSASPPSASPPSSECGSVLGSHGSSIPPPPAGPFNEHVARDMLYQKLEIDRPLNTKKAVQPKMKEWEKYIDHTYTPAEGDRSGAQYLPTKENTYKFMLYQALRGQRKKGGKRKRNDRMVEDDDEEEALLSLGRGFNGAEYDLIISQFDLGSNDAHALLSNPSNPIGVKMFQHYKLALLHLHHHYVQRRVCEDLPFEPFIWGRDHVALAKVVKNRRHKISIARYEEKMTSDATPYTQVDLIPKVEEALWRLGKKTMRSQLAALRNRHAFLMTTCGIMRFENLAKRELSDVFSFTWRSRRDVHDLLITMFQIAEGKVVVVLCVWLFFFVPLILTTLFIVSSHFFLR